MSNESALTIQPQEPSVGQMLQGMLTSIQQGNVTEQQVAVVERMAALYVQMKERDSEQAFTVALHAVQSEIPVIVAKTVIPNRGKYEKYEDIMEVVGPILRRHGFTESFSNSYTDNRITETCTLSHVGGFKKSNSFTVRIGMKGDHATQEDCKVASVAKRNALLNALNIVIRQDVLQSDDDPHNEGGAITQEQADELRDMVDESGGDRQRFLDFAHSEEGTKKTFEEIASTKLPVLHARIRAKMKAAGK